MSLSERAAHVAQQQRAVAVEADAGGGVGERHLQEGDAVRLEQDPGVGVEDGAAAEREDAVVGGERVLDRALLQRAEVRLAVVDEDLGDLLAGGGLDVRVGVAEGDAELLGHQPADGGLAGAGGTDQDDDGAHACAPRVCSGPAIRTGRLAR